MRAQGVIRSHCGRDYVGPELKSSLIPILPHELGKVTPFLKIDFTHSEAPHYEYDIFLENR